jgi:rhodanese-related sulfurtransferase
MRIHLKKLYWEMAVIVSAATVIGLLWNFSLLRDAYTGKLTVSDTVTATTGSAAMIAPASLQQVRELFVEKSATFVDAREAAAFAKGHIAGARSLPLADLDAKLAAFRAAVPPEATLVIYCSGYGCHDSKNLADKLTPVGYQTILLYEGGYPEWKDANLPVAGATP